MGSSFMVQAAMEVMKSHSLEENCSVVNISSISAHQTQPNRWTYAASKGAVNILTKNMALDLAKFKIRVNSVSPAWIWSPEVAKVTGPSPTTLHQAATGGREKWEPVWGKFHISNRSVIMMVVTVTRLGEMAEVAAAVAFLASKDAAFVNATDLKVVMMLIFMISEDGLHGNGDGHVGSEGGGPGVVEWDGQVDGGYGAMSAEGHGEASSFAGSSK